MAAACVAGARGSAVDVEADGGAGQGRRARVVDRDPAVGDDGAPQLRGHDGDVGESETRRRRRHGMDGAGVDEPVGQGRFDVVTVLDAGGDARPGVGEAEHPVRRSGEHDASVVAHT